MDGGMATGPWGWGCRARAMGMVVQECGVMVSMANGGSTLAGREKGEQWRGEGELP